MMTILKGRKDIKHLLLKFGVSIALSLSGFLYYRIKTKRINPTHPHLSDSDSEVEYEGRFKIRGDTKEEIDSETNTHDKPCIRVRVESPSKNKHEIEGLRKKAKFLQEHLKCLENQLLEYYVLEDQHKSVRELQSRLKLSNLEVKVLSMKIEALHADKKRLEAQVNDYSRIEYELEVAREKITVLRRKVRVEAQQSKEHVLDLTRRVIMLRDQEHGASTSGFALEVEVERLREANEKLWEENAGLARKLEEPKKAELSKAMVHLREEQEHLTKKIATLQAHRCADEEKLVHLRWINERLRHELRNSIPNSESEAKHLIRVPDIINLGYDHGSSSQSSDLFDTSIDSPTNKPNPKTTNFFSKLIKVIRGKPSDPRKTKSGQASPRRRYSLVSLHSNNSSMDQNRLSSLTEEGPVRFVLERQNSYDFHYFKAWEGRLDEQAKMEESGKHAEVLRGSTRVLKRSSSAYV